MSSWRLRIVRRQWAILAALAPLMHGLTLSELAAMTGMHERTIRRDVAGLIDVGFALEWRRPAWGETAARIRLSVPLTRRRMVREALDELMNIEGERQPADEAAS